MTSNDTLLNVTSTAPASAVLSYLSALLGPALTALVLLLSLLFDFYLLAKVSDEAIAPALEEASIALNVPSDVACATLLALGSSAPEVFISSMSAFAHSGNTEDGVEYMGISMGTIFGSAIIAFTVIPSFCVFASPEGIMKLEVIPLLRDSGFYSIGLFALVMFSLGGAITSLECLFLLILFIFYLISMRLLLNFYAPNSLLIEEEDLRLEMNIVENSSSNVINGDSNPEETNEVIDLIEEEPLNEDTQPVNQRKFRCSYYLLPPFCARSEESIKRYWKTILLISIIYVAGLSEICLELTVSLAELIGFSDHMLGAVLVALGAQVPDTFASLAVARKGEGPGAVANAIGSQVMNILLAIGLPFFLTSLFSNKPINVDFSDTESSGVFLLITLISLVTLATRRLLCVRVFPTIEPFCGLSKLDAVILLGIYVIFLIWQFASSHTSL